jgi:hypothetical protein
VANAQGLSVRTGRKLFGITHLGGREFEVDMETCHL